MFGLSSQRWLQLRILVDVVCCAGRGNGFQLLGGVVLAVTGTEALYAGLCVFSLSLCLSSLSHSVSLNSDLGHFGRRPIQLAWLVVVLPSVVLSYLGQVLRFSLSMSLPLSHFLTLTLSRTHRALAC